MSSKWLVLMAACLVMAVGMGTAQAYPQMAPTSGLTGLIETPTAYLVGARTVELALDYTEAARYNDGFEGWPVRLVAGVSENVELGVAYLMLEPKGSGTPIRHTAVGAKWQFRQENAGPAVALGVEYRERKQYSGVRKLTSIFLVGSKKLTGKETEVSLVGNAGVAYDSWTGGSGTEVYLTPFLGAEICFSQGTTIAVDYKWDQGGGWPGPNCQARFGMVIRHPLNDQLTAELGMTRLEYDQNWGGEIPLRTFGGVCWRFGKGK